MRIFQQHDFVFLLQQNVERQIFIMMPLDSAHLTSIDIVVDTTCQLLYPQQSVFPFQYIANGGRALWIGKNLHV